VLPTAVRVGPAGERVGAHRCHGLHLVRASVPRVLWAQCAAPKGADPEPAGLKHPPLPCCASHAALLQTLVGQQLGVDAEEEIDLDAVDAEEDAEEEVGAGLG